MPDTPRYGTASITESENMPLVYTDNSSSEVLRFGGCWSSAEFHGCMIYTNTPRRIYQAASIHTAAENNLLEEDSEVWCRDHLRSLLAADLILFSTFQLGRCYDR